jgi:hypothetical protein
MANPPRSGFGLDRSLALGPISKPERKLASLARRRALRASAHRVVVTLDSASEVVS